jgi:excinuclease ABC subunit B
MTINIEVGKRFSRSKLINQLVTLQYSRNDIALTRGQFRVRGDSIDVIPSHSSDYAWKIAFFGDDIESIHEFDPLTGHKRKKISQIAIYANSHFVTPEAQLEKAIIAIVQEADIVIKNFEQEGKLLEAQRLAQRIKYDVEMLKETGLCKGIENYSRHLTGRDQGQPPPTLFEYLPNDSLLFIDESHVTVPQINGMYNGDRSRKMTLVDYGFRLPSALDNRPLKFEEWDQMRSNTVYVSATPGKYELGLTDGVYHEQLIRPTGLLDPICMIRPVSTQIDDLLHECKLAKAKDERVMVTTLTKKMAEDLSAYMHEAGISVTYLHSEILTLERVEILNSLRTGEIDVLIGVNLLREGLDIPQVALVAILDADKEGFLRSETSLIQTIGRAARNVNGRVILYADVMTKSLTKAISETERRRKLQDDFNKANNITPTQILKTVNYEFKMLKEVQEKTSDTSVRMSAADLLKQIERKKKDMIRYATDLEFEKAASLRDEIKILENTLLQL